jgi:hypothetical protein
MEITMKWRVAQMHILSSSHDTSQFHNLKFTSHTYNLGVTIRFVHRGTEWSNVLRVGRVSADSTQKTLKAPLEFEN